MKEANLKSSGPEPGMTLFSAAQGQVNIRSGSLIWSGSCYQVPILPDPIARMPD
jgi:hypothetical protein